VAARRRACASSTLVTSWSRNRHARSSVTPHRSSRSRTWSTPSGIIATPPLRLQGREETLCDSVVVAVAGPADARDDASFGERSAVVLTRVRATSIGVMYEPGARMASLERVVERGEGEFAVIRVAGRPADNASREQVEQHGEIAPALRSGGSRRRRAAAARRSRCQSRPVRTSSAQTSVANSERPVARSSDTRGPSGQAPNAKRQHGKCH
jgi:hypothetical protein